MNKKPTLAFCFFWCLASSVLTAQVKDFQSWNAVSIDWNLTDALTASGEQEIRFDNNASHLGSYISVVGLQYKVNSWFRVGASYRYTLGYDIEELTLSNHRIYTDLNFRYKPGRFTLGYRVRYQIVFQMPSQKKFTLSNPQHLRHKFSAKYNIAKTPLYPFAEVELYESLNNPVENSIQKIRYTAGLGYPITKYCTVETYYRLYEKSYYFIKPKKDYILGLNLNFSF